MDLLADIPVLPGCVKLPKPEGGLGCRESEEAFKVKSCRKFVETPASGGIVLTWLAECRRRCSHVPPTIQGTSRFLVTKPSGVELAHISRTAGSLKFDPSRSILSNKYQFRLVLLHYPRPRREDVRPHLKTLQYNPNITESCRMQGHLLEVRSIAVVSGIRVPDTRTLKFYGPLISAFTFLSSI